MTDALALAHAGLCIVPLQPCSKQPAFKSWQERASTDATVLRSWWDRFPTANIGHVIQPGWVIVDCDPRHNGLIGWQNLLARYGDLLATWRVHTGRQDGGFHLFFTTDAALELPEATDIAQGVQALGPRHLVVVAPSLHPQTNQPYTWDHAQNPWTMPTPAAAPGWLVDLLATPRKRRTRASGPPLEKAVQTATRDNRSECYAAESTKVPRDIPPPQGTLVERSPGSHLVALACEPTHLPALLEACGLPATLEVNHSTGCPFHDDQVPSATLLGPTAERRSYGIYCHSSSCNKYYSLTDIFKARTSANLLSIHSETDHTGQTKDHAALRLQWLTRLLEAAGIVHLYELGCPSLPAGAPDSVREVWQAFLHVRRIRSATRKASDPLPLSWRFVLDWLGPACRLSQHLVQKAKSWLICRGLLHADHEENGLTFWGIGSRALRRTRRDAPVLKTERANVADVEAIPMSEPVVHNGRSCPLADEPGHDPTEETCTLWQAWLRTKAKKVYYGSPPLIELHHAP